MIAAPNPTRERILVAASRLFATRGYDGTSTRQIADAVGVRQPSLFHHFSSKQAIMEELLELTYGEAAAVAERLAATPGPAAERLREYVRWDVAYTLALPYDLAAAAAGDVLDQPAFARFRADRDRLHAARRALIEQGIAAGEFVPIDPGYAQQLVGAVALQTIRLRTGSPEAAADFVVRGLSLGARLSSGSR